MKKQIRSQAMLFLLGALSFGAHAQVQLGGDIDGGEAHDFLGTSVSLSSDGNVLAIGAPNSTLNPNPGHVRVYRRDATAALGWRQLGGDIDGEAERDNSGRSVSLSADGRVLAIGAPFNGQNGHLSGHVRVYERDATASLGWSQVGGDIDGDVAERSLGNSVSLSSDGRVLAVGAPNTNSLRGTGPGHVRVYKRDASDNWVQLGGVIDGEAEHDLSGRSVSLSSDGRVLAIGAPFNDENGEFSGHVRVYERDATASLGWSQVGEDIDGGAERDFLGSSVSLSSDGNVLAIGSPSGWPRLSPGYVRVYKRDVTAPLGWRQLGGDIDGEAAGDRSGRNVSLSADGSVLAIGAPENDGINGDGSGHVRVYKRDATSTDAPLGWSQLGGDIDGEAELDGSGRSVSLSADGSILAIGAPYSDANGNSSGHVRVYHIGASGVSIGAPVQVNASSPFEVTLTFDRGGHRF